MVDVADVDVGICKEGVVKNLDEVLVWNSLWTATAHNAHSGSNSHTRGNNYFG